MTSRIGDPPMDRSTALVYATVALIVGVSVVSGPAVGLIDLTPPRADTAGLGQGNATVDRVEAPDRISIERGFQSESYRLEVPDARVNLAAVTGRPILNYRIEIEALGYTRTSSHFLDSGRTGWTTLTLADATLSESAVSGTRHEGTLSIIVQSDGNGTTVYERSVVVEVQP